MTLMLLLLAGFWIIQAGFVASLSYVEDKVGVVADLKDGVTQAAVEDLEARLGAMPEVKSVEYTSKQQALQSRSWARSRTSRTRPIASCR
jgi:cell division protein FtsX